MIHALFAAHVLRGVDPWLREFHGVPHDVESRSRLLVKLRLDCV